MGYLDLSDKDFVRFKALVYENCGINLHDGKKELVRARLGKRLRETGFKNFNQYYKYLVEQDTGEELIKMIDAISTNLTSFFRETKHFDFLINGVLPPYNDAFSSRGSGSLRVWSAGCSSGEEPYTLAMCIFESLENIPHKDIRILATDISTKVLTMATTGVYHQSRIENVPQPMLRKYFQRGSGKREGYFRVKPFVRKMVEFKRFNLMDPFPFQEKYHIIFCRNVMIYFDKMVQQSLVNKFYDCLTEGGYLFIGHSESLMSTSHKFKYVKPTIYLKS